MAIQTFEVNELKLMPTKSLDTLKVYFNGRKQELSKSLKSLQKKYDNLLGITTIDLGDNRGAVVSKLPTSLDGAVNKSKDLAGPMAALFTISDLSDDAPITNLQDLGIQGNSSELFKSLGSKLDGISSPILADSLSREQALEAQQSQILSKMATNEDDIDLINQEISKINTIIRQRLDGEIEEPRYDVSNLNVQELSEFIQSQIIDLSEVTGESAVEEDPVFDLEFGPPISRSGQFILSRDGIYYDSRSGGLPEVVGLIEVAKKWNFKYAPNIGGKGQFFEERDLTQIADTIFDLDNINESSELKAAYEADLILQELSKDKIKVSYDLSSQIDKLLDQGESATGSVITNLKQSVLGTIAAFSSKEKKRKKQIEVALFFGIFSFRDGKFFEREEEINFIPVNDFSYLRDVGAAPNLEKQKRLVLETGSVSDVILPITPKFLTTPQAARRSVDEVTLSFGGIGDFVKVDGNLVESLKPFIKNIGQELSEGLLAGYNFLNPSSVDPSSSNFNMDNFAKGYNGLDGRTVASSPQDIFPSGLGIPYFYGLTGDVDDDAFGDAGKFSYGIISHERSSKIHDLFYTSPGITFDFWSHLPLLTSITEGYLSYTTSGHWYRLFFGCENSGDSLQTAYNPDVISDYSESKVLGYICGIRNKHITDNSVSSLDTSTHGDVEFIFAPTVGCNTNGDDGNDWGHSIKLIEDRAFTFDLSANTPFSQIHQTFVNLSLVFDFKESSIALYIDGSKVKSQPLIDVFGVERPKLPTFFTLSSESTSSIHYTSGGPTLKNQRLTPIVLGGGYSDLSPSGFLGANLDTSSFEDNNYQNAMWSNRGQKQRSGLNGFLGSFKIYDKALNYKDVRFNFDSQKGFFKSIAIPTN